MPHRPLKKVEKTLVEVNTYGKFFLPHDAMNRLTQSEIEQALQECLRRIAGDTYPTEWKPNDNVICCCGLDSQHGIELACDLESRLGIEIPLKENPLVLDDDGEGRKRARTFSEVVDYLTALVS